MKENTLIWSFRLTEPQSQQLEAQINQLKLSRADFFRNIAIGNNANSFLPKQDVLKLLHYQHMINFKMEKIAEYCSDKSKDNPDLQVMQIFMQLKQIQRDQQNLLNIVTHNLDSSKL